MTDVSDPFATRTARYLAHNQTIRGVVRHTLVARQLADHLPPPPARVADIGGGAGAQAIPLARRGYDVYLLDPSSDMLGRAEAQLAHEPVDVRQRLRLVEGYGERAEEILGEDAFDAVLCHGVLMYVDDSAPIIRSLGRIVRPGGIVSILTKNAGALAMRSAFEQRYGDALRALESDSDRGGMGVTRADSLDCLTGLLECANITRLQWYGVRIFTDHLGDREADEKIDDILALEAEAAGRDPYRQVARLLHVIGRRRT